MPSFHPSAAEEQALGLEHFVTQEIRALTAYAGFIALCVNDFPLFQIQCVLLCSALLVPGQSHCSVCSQQGGNGVFHLQDERGVCRLSLFQLRD